MSQREEDDDANASRPASAPSSAWQPTQASTSHSFRSLYTSFQYSKRSEGESARGESEPVIASDNVQPTEDTHALRKWRSLLRAKIEDAEGTIPTLRCAPLGTGVTFEQSLDALQTREREHGSRLLTMCCSDKLLKWQTAGFSGALLCHLLVKPLFFHSVVVGAPASPAHLARALFWRVQRYLDVSAPHIHIAVVPRTEGAEADPDPAKSASKAGKFSIVLLSRGDGADCLEVLKSRLGYVVAAETRGDSTHDDSDWMEIDRDAEGCQQMARTSCISSFALATHFARIRDHLVANTCTRNSTPADAPPSLPSCATTHLASSYRQLRQASSEYTLRKTTFYNTLSELHLDSWVKKPACLSDWLLTQAHEKSDAPHDAAD